MSKNKGLVMKRINLLLIFLLVWSFTGLYVQQEIYAESSNTKFVGSLDNNSSNKDIIDNEIIIKYKDASKISSITTGIKSQTINKNMKISKVKFNSNDELQSQINRLSKDPNVEFIQPNYRYKKADANISYIQSTYSSKGYENLQWIVDDLQINNAWAQSTGSGIKIAVIDTGIDISHEDLTGKVVGGQDFTGSGYYTDDEGHGTHIAGIIAAQRGNGIGIDGLAYDSKLLAVKVLDNNGEGDTYAISQGIMWAADQGAKILNLSLGNYVDDAMLKAAINYADSKGCFIVAASGNDGLSGVMYPAAYDNVVAVGSTNESNQLSSFSNFGSQIDVVAPGVNILSTVPESITSYKYAYASGTSMSAAVVSAQLSLVLAKNPLMNKDVIFNLIKTSSFNLGGTSPNEAYGYGILDVNKILVGVSNALVPKVRNDLDDNAFFLSKQITQSTQISDRLLSDFDANWYKLTIPFNKILKLKFNVISGSGLTAEIFKDSFDYPIKMIAADDPTDSEYYMYNYGDEINYYIKVYNDDETLSNWTLDILYQNIDEGNYIPKDSTLKYNIDDPRIGQAVSGNSLNVRGWVISKIGIEKVEAVVDGIAQEINYGGYRPDVYNVFKDYGDMFSGFEGSVDISKLSYGNHSLFLRFTDSRGVVNQSDTVNFIVQNSLIYNIDEPRYDEALTDGSLIVRGWVLSKAGIAKVEAIIDGTVHNINSGLYRPDVYNVFKDYNNINSGFNSTIDIKNLPYGSHSLIMRFTDGKGLITESNTVSFKVPNSLIYNIDEPRLDEALTGDTLTVRGWSLSKAGITKIEAVVDGTVSTVQSGIYRPDVYNVFREYNNINSGFNSIIDIKNLSYGSHDLIMRFTDGNGVVTESKTVNFIIPNTILYNIDEPRLNEEITGNVLTVRGWALSKVGIAKVETVIDNGQIHEISYGGFRPDVYNVFRDYNNQNSGFNSNIDISNLSYGKHTLTMRFIDGKGVITQSNTITFEIPTTLFNVDEPFSGQFVENNTLTVRGWALNKAGIAKVQVAVNGTVQEIQYGEYRPDVYAAFPKFNNLYSEFKGSIDVSNLPSGNNSIKVRFIDVNSRIIESNSIIFNKK
jgi:hypothetical protein